MRYPNDRRLVDAQGKIMDHWLGPLKLLEPLLDARIVKALQTLANASQEADEDDPFSLNAALGALPIDNEPLFTEDWAVTFKNADSRGRRVPLSLFEPVSKELVSTTALSGNSSVDIAIPEGYTDIALIAKGVSPSGAAHLQVGFSEDGGATLLSGSAYVFNNGGVNSGVVSAALAVLYPTTDISANANNTFYSHIYVYDYAGAADKFTHEHGIEYVQQHKAWRGTRAITSTAPVNLTRYATATGTFDAGTVELWGIP
jgi:hypothetical protein